MSTLRVDLGPLARLKAHQDFALEERWDPMEVGGETVIFDGVVRVRGAVERIHSGAEITGTAEVRVELRCGRCLDPYTDDLSIPFRLFLLEAGPVDARLGQDWDEDEVSPYREQVDLTPEIEAAVVLALPVRPLCSEDCPGLCPVCGSRRDAGCMCEGREAEPFVGRLGLTLLDAERSRAAGAGSAAWTHRTAEDAREREESTSGERPKGRTRAGPGGKSGNREGTKKETGRMKGNEDRRHASVRKGT